MLKKFLKFFKQDGEGIEDLDPQISYLDYLLEHIETPVSSHLEACQEHDPFLLTIVEALRSSMPETWSEDLRSPLHDEHTPTQAALAQPPAASPPPPPIPGERDETLEYESVDESEIEEVEEDAQEISEVDETIELSDEATPEEESESSESSQTPQEEDESSEASQEDVQDASDVEEAEELGDESIVEVAPAAESQEMQEHTQEFDSEAVLEQASTQGQDGLPRIDRDEVLQAGRVYLGMLIENDRLPPQLQLSGEETTLARDLLVAYFLGKTESGKAQKLLRLVEQKFSEGKFSQARLLLQLFQAERQTRIRNDRNIFYEDMIQRLGTRRKNPVPTDAAVALELMGEAEDGVPSHALFTWLHEEVSVNLHLFLQQPDKVERWSAIAQQSTIPNAEEHLLRYIPPRRWRSLHWQEEGTNLLPLVQDHLTPDMLARYVSNHLRTCYFVLRAVGDTGLEGYLDTFFEWTGSSLGLDMTQVLPELYRRTMGDVDTIQFIFRDVYNRIARAETEAWFDTLEEDAIQDACQKALLQVTQCNLNEVLPGHYDFGSLVLDQLLNVEYPTKEFAFKVHRLV